MVTPEDIIIEKDFFYEQHTLSDKYIYTNLSRCFQWDKIKEKLAGLESFQQTPAAWGVLQNRKNMNGKPPVAKNAVKDLFYNEMVDAFGVEDMQSVPLYASCDTTIPERYGRDGSLVKILDTKEKHTKATLACCGGEWIIPSKYIHIIKNESSGFRKTIFVDRTNQNVTTLEKVANKWLVRSMNPATTGIYKPPYRRKTPLGIFVLQEKKERMFYLEDGSNKIEGFALYANRFTTGGYLHGVAIEYPETEVIEFCPTLGTIPTSHMCVRNATSHAKFIYDWAPVYEAFIYVIE